MQQLTVQNQADFLKLQPFTPQEKTFSQNDSYSSSGVKKSFSDFVNEAKMSAEKPEQAEKSENSATKVSSDTEKKENLEAAAESSEKELNPEISDEKKNLAAGKKMPAEEKNSGKEAKISDFRNADAEKTEISKKTDSVTKSQEIQKNLSIRGEKKSEGKNLKKENASDSAEKTKNHVENEELALQKALAAPENLPEIKNEQNSQDDFNLKLSDTADEDSEKIAAAEPKAAKTLFLDKEQKIVVQDFRSENSEDSGSPRQEKSSAEIVQLRRDENNNPELTMDFAANAQQNITSSSSQAASSAGSDFQAMLSNQIQENAGEIVKAGNIVLKDNDVGSIKLILHPESLGNVKIDLHLSDKNISGKIIVASQEAFNAFKETAENLKQAFAQSGFDSVGLELSLANQNSGGNNSSGNRNNPAAEFAMRKVYGEFNVFSGEEISEMEIIENSSRNSVNIVA